MHRSKAGVLAVFLTIGGLISACGSDAAEPTAAERLAELEGRELSPAEVAEQEEIFALLCRLDDRVLIEMWADMSESQLAVQDIAFGVTCPERNGVYADATGRFATAD